MIGLILVLSATSPSSAAPIVSYTEEYPPGSGVSLHQGMWDCGSIDEARATSLLNRMAHHPESQVSMASKAGCTRTLDPERRERPWRVVRHVSTICDQRRRHGEEMPLMDGSREIRTFESCGIEAHALLVERDGVQRTAIDIIDFQSYE